MQKYSYNSGMQSTICTAEARVVPTMHDKYRRYQQKDYANSEVGYTSTYILGSVALGKHDHATAIALELVNVAVHTTGSGGTE